MKKFVFLLALTMLVADFAAAQAGRNMPSGRTFRIRSAPEKNTGGGSQTQRTGETKEQREARERQEAAQRESARQRQETLRTSTAGVETKKSVAAIDKVNLICGNCVTAEIKSAVEAREVGATKEMVERYSDRMFKSVELAKEKVGTFGANERTFVAEYFRILSQVRNENDSNALNALEMIAADALAGNYAESLTTVIRTALSDKSTRSLTEKVETALESLGLKDVNGQKRFLTLEDLIKCIKSLARA